MKEKVTYIFFLALLIPFYLMGQNKELVDRIALRNRVNKLAFEHKYDSIVILSKIVPDRPYLYLYGIETDVALSYFELQQKADAYRWLVRAINHQEISSADNLKYIVAGYKLENDREYNTLIKSFDKQHDRYAGGLNQSLLSKCLEIFYTDLRIRTVWMSIGDSNSAKCFAQGMWLSDSINVDKIKELLRDNGYFPGISDIGVSFTAAFNYVITHAAGMLDRDTLVNYLKAATLKGELPNWYAPRLLDKLEYDKGRPLLFGEFGTSDNYTEDGTYVYPDIADIEHVDRRRSEFLLPPLYSEKESRKCILPKGYEAKQQR